MRKLFAGMFGFLATVGAGNPSVASLLYDFDDIECPNSLLD